MDGLTFTLEEDITKEQLLSGGLYTEADIVQKALYEVRKV